MKKPVLVIMAAGMGSRYGSLKQLDPVGNYGQLIIDYSIYDAHRAGFDTVIFVIKEENEADFRACIGDRVSRVMDVKYAFQRKGDLPEGCNVPPERTKIEKGPPPRYTEDDGQTWTELPGDTVVSMILWGFTRSFMDEAWARFPAFLDKALAENPAKAEYFLPDVVSELIEEGRARMKVLQSKDKWYGVTYREDKPAVVAAIAEKTKAGLYPDQQWEV